MSAVEKERQKESEYRKKFKEDTKNAFEDDLSHGLIGNMKPPYDAFQLGVHEIKKLRLERRKGREESVNRDKCEEGKHWVAGYTNKKGIYIRGYCAKNPRAYL
jgi:hypothetical protein